MVLLWLVFWSVLPLLAGNPPIVTPDRTQTPLPKASQVCVSSADRVRFETVHKGHCLFRTVDTPADVWFRLTIPPAKEDALLFTSDLFTIKQGALAVSVNGAEAVSVDGAVPLAKRPFMDARLAIPIVTSPTEKIELLVKMKVHDQRQLTGVARHVFLQTKRAALIDVAIHWLGQGAFLGGVLIMALYHLFIWRAERLAAAAWYSVSLCALGLYFAVNRNLVPLLPWDFAPRLALWLHPLVGPILAGFFLQFIRKYAHLPQRGDRILRFMVVVMMLWVPVCALGDSLGYHRLTATSVNLLSIFGTVMAMGALSVATYRGDQESRVLAISLIPTVLGLSVLIASMSGLIPPGGLVDAAMQLGVTLQVSLLGLALSDRIRRLRIDRDQAQAIVRLTLPDVIAERLKAGEKFIADRHTRVAVLFADLAGFTPMSATHEPETIVQLLDVLFRELDALAHQVGAEKIKTIGDCYMVVAGAPSPHADPVAALADLALGIPSATERVMKQVSHLSYDLPERLSVRVGLHVGPVVAGVLGEQKLAYDLWGDTVNTASRMESHGIVGRIQCSQQVVEALSDRYSFEPRGEITIRGKGTLPVWFLIGKRTTAQDS